MYHLHPGVPSASPTVLFPVLLLINILFLGYIMAPAFLGRNAAEPRELVERTETEINYTLSCAEGPTSHMTANAFTASAKPTITSCPRTTISSPVGQAHITDSFAGSDPQTLSLDIEPGSSTPATPSFTHQAPTTTWLTFSPARTSTYPRVAPPLFLYPEPMFPRTPVSSAGSALPEGYLPDLLPTGTIYVLYVLIALGAAWWTIVYWVNFPPRFLLRSGEPDGCVGRETEQKRKEKKRVGFWYGFSKKISTCLADPVGSVYGALGRGKGEKTKKPVRKKAKYAPLHQSEEESSASSSTSWSFDSGTIEMELRTRDPVAALRRHAAQSIPLLQDSNVREDNGSSTQLLPRADEEQCLAGTLTASHRAQYDGTHTSPAAMFPGEVSPCTLESRQSPLFPPIPPRNRRSSTTWLADRAAFDAESPVSQSYSHCRSQSDAPQPIHSPYCPALDSDVDLEAQCSPSGTLSSSRLPLSKEHQGGRVSGGVDKTGSWLDLVDGAVNKAVDKVVRWMDDNGGEKERVILPTVESSRGLESVVAG